MKKIEFIYNCKGKDYIVHVNKKRQRNIYFRIKEDGFYVSAPYICSISKIKEGLDKYSNNLITKYNQRNSNFSVEEDYVFILGEKFKISSLNIKNMQEFNSYLRNIAKQKITELVRKNEQIMEIKKPYKIAIRKTRNQFGSNSKQTRTLSFQIDLIHYSEEIIESVVIHELAHDFYRNHSKEFYNVVYKYCPNYDIYDKKLRKGIHK